MHEAFTVLVTIWDANHKRINPQVPESYQSYCRTTTEKRTVSASLVSIKCKDFRSSFINLNVNLNANKRYFVANRLFSKRCCLLLDVFPVWIVPLLGGLAVRPQIESEIGT